MLLVAVSMVLHTYSDKKARTPRMSMPRTKKEGHCSWLSSFLRLKRFDLSFGSRTSRLKMREMPRMEPTTMNRACLQAKLRPKATELLRRSKRRIATSRLNDPVGLLKDAILLWKCKGEWKWLC